MKKIFLILTLVFTIGALYGQNYIDFRKQMRMVYGGDTMIITFSGDTVLIYGNHGNFKISDLLKLDELIVRDTSILDLILEHGGGGGEYIFSSGLTEDEGDVKLGGLDVEDRTYVGAENAYIYFQYSDESDTGIFIYNVNPVTGHAISVGMNRSGVSDPVLSFDSYLAHVYFDSLGLGYDNNWAYKNASNDRWIPDKHYVDSVSSGADPHITDSTLYIEEPNEGNYFDLKLGSYTGGWIDHYHVFSMPGLVKSFQHYYDSSMFYYVTMDNASNTISELSLNSTYDGIFKAIYETDTILIGDTIGLRISNVHSTEWDNNNLITKGYADANYQGIITYEGSLTDGAPTYNEIQGIVGAHAAALPTGLIFTIYDTSGSQDMYIITVHGSCFYPISDSGGGAVCYVE